MIRLKQLYTYTYQIFWPELIGSKKSKDHKYEVEKINEDGAPHVPQKIKHLALYCE